MTKTLPTPRDVAVAIPFRATAQGVQVCLISSRKHKNRWVLPKGGLEKREQASVAAVREMWEEAGLRPAPSPVLSVGPPVDDHKFHKNASNVPRARYYGFAIPIGHGNAYEFPEWPERGERRRQWVNVAQAQELTAWRLDVATVLNQAIQADLLRAKSI